MPLPDIHLRVSVSHDEFLRRIVDLGWDPGQLTVEDGATYSLEALTFVWFTAPACAEHEDLKFYFRVPKCEAPRIEIELVAQSWGDNETIASEETYVETAKRWVGTWLNNYNRSYRQRHQLSFSQPRYGPAPSKRSKLLVQGFCTLANKSVLHPLDWQRFYKVVWELRQPLSEETMRLLLLEGGFSKSSSSELGELYSHLVQFKASKNIW